MSIMLPYILILILAIIAFLYSSVGHGGASGYLAALALFGISIINMRTAALLLNLIVSFIAFVHFYRQGFFKWKILALFAITSIPAAYIGARFILPDTIYKQILAVILIFTAFRLITVKKNNDRESGKDPNIITAAVSGAVIGFISGLIGIGGGIILSPILLLFKWANMKETAAVSSAFIFVNSVAGLIAISSASNFHNFNYFWTIGGVSGALAGGFFGARKFSNDFMRKLLSLVMFIASLKLLFP